LNNATLPFVLALADDGWKKAMAHDPHLRNGLNIYDGQVTHPAVAEALGMELSLADTIVGATPMRRQSDARA
jgi:alanine dehydrogenase